MCKDPSIKIFHAVSEDDGSSEELTELVGFTKGARLLKQSLQSESTLVRLSVVATYQIMA